MAGTLVCWEGARPLEVVIGRRARRALYRRVVRFVRAGMVRRLRPFGVTPFVVAFDAGPSGSGEVSVKVEYGGWVEVHTPAGWVAVSTSGRRLRRVLLAEYPLSALVHRVCEKGGVR